MTEKESVLYSHYIIDGTRCEMTPAELIDECLEFPEGDEGMEYADIIDESTEPPLTPFVYESDSIPEYTEDVSSMMNEDRAFPMLYPEHHTRLLVAKALMDRIWTEGHFRLGNLRLWAQWEWNTRPIGNMAAFYRSVQSAGSYIFDLGIKMSDYLFIESDTTSNARFYAWLPETEETGSEESGNEMQAPSFKSSPYESSHPWIGEKRRCSQEVLTDVGDSILIYVPFDTCGYRLGGSLLSQMKGHNGGLAPEINDPDYFIDCYEVVRELVEDGIAIAGASVADGGLAAAIKKITGPEAGVDIDISGLLSSYQEDDRTKILFTEKPGVLLQITEDNYDYFDSQFLLQDVAYYPIGRLNDEHKGIRFTDGSTKSLSDILASLLAQDFS